MLLEDAGRSASNRPAIAFKDHSLSYGALTKTLDRMSSRLPPLQGRRVMVMLPDSLTGYALHLKMFCDGACIVPVSPLIPSGVFQELFQKVEPHLVMTTQSLQKRHSDVVSRIATLVLGASTPDQDGICDWSFAGPAEQVRELHANSLDAEEVRVIFPTSGSTGAPKGVCLGTDSLMAATHRMRDFLELDDSRRTLVALPMYDYYGYIQILAHILARASYRFGATIAFPAALLRHIDQDDVTDLAVVPYTLDRLLHAAGPAPSPALSRLRIITSSSDVLAPELLRRAFSHNPQLRIFNIYGLTEAGRACYRESTLR